MLKRVLVVGAVLGTGLFVVGTGAVLGVTLGSRALVVSAAAVKPAAAFSIAPTGNASSRPLLVAMDAAAAAAGH